MSWLPVVILAVLLVALAVAVVVETVRARRRIDPLTPDQVARAVAVSREREASDG